jgi:DNA topoisomerase IA
MGTNIVVVESPAKAKTIEKYLGKNFKVLASYGHVRDLVPKEGAVDPEHGYAMKYEVLEKNEKHVAAIIKGLKKADALYLATDPDREGEAISWHLHELLKDKGALNGKAVHRVVFYEITKRAIQAAIENPRDLSSELVNAQQARRALDYLVGFTKRKSRLSNPESTGRSTRRLAPKLQLLWPSSRSSGRKRSNSSVSRTRPGRPRYAQLWLPPRTASCA